MQIMRPSERLWFKLSRKLLRLKSYQHKGKKGGSLMYASVGI